MGEPPPTWHYDIHGLPVYGKPAPLDPTPATWQEQDEASALAELLATQNMTLDGLRRFLNAAWAVVVAYDNEPDPMQTRIAVLRLVDVAEAVTGKPEF